MPSYLFSTSLLPFFPVPTCPSSYNSFLFRPPPRFYSVTSRHVPFCHVLIRLFPYHPVPSCLIPFHVVSSCSVLLPSLSALSNPSSSHLKPSRLVLSRLVLSNSIDAYPVPSLLSIDPHSILFSYIMSSPPQSKSCPFPYYRISPQLHICRSFVV